MADITIYKPAGLTINVVDGEDPSPALQAQITALEAEVAVLNAFIDSLQAKIAAAQAALA
jgi:uncharacterized protein YceH (UPF0502 family)